MKCTSVFPSGGQEALQNRGWDQVVVEICPQYQRDASLHVISSATARLLQASAGVSLNQGQVCSKQPCTGYAQATDTQAPSFSQIGSFKGRFGWWFCLVYNPAYLWERVWGRTTGVGIRMGPFSVIFPCSLRGKRDLLIWAEQAGSFASRQHDYISGVPTGKQKTEE